jgi:outer membrane protein assembly factor BamE
MRRSRLLLVAASCALIAACTYKPGFINEYKIDVQQGNVLTQEMVAQLKPGQTRDQVRFLLGTPLVADIFHQQRWDYVYRYKDGQTGKVDSRKLTVFLIRKASCFGLKEMPRSPMLVS